MKHTSIYRELLQLAVITTTLFVITQGSLQHARVEGSSMAPTLVHGDHLVVNKLAYAQLSIPFLWTKEDPRNRLSGNYTFSAPTRGDIVIFSPPNHVSLDYDLVKRILGIPGDTVVINNDGLYINGQKHIEPYLSTSDYQVAASSSISPSNVFEVKTGHYFVLGDNRGYSNDSRSWGTVSGANITGKVWLTLPQWQIWDIPRELFPDDS